MLNVIALRGDRGDDAEVVAGTLDGPPEVRAGIDSGKSAVGKHDVRRLKLVTNSTVAALKPAVAATQGRAHVADTFAGTSD